MLTRSEWLQFVLPAGLIRPELWLDATVSKSRQWFRTWCTGWNNQPIPQLFDPQAIKAVSSQSSQWFKGTLPKSHIIHDSQNFWKDFLSHHWHSNRLWHWTLSEKKGRKVGVIILHLNTPWEGHQDIAISFEINLFEMSFQGPHS